MTTSATNSGKSYLGVDNRAVVTNIDTLFARLNALSSSVGSLTWGDVLTNGAQATTDLDLNGNNATGAIRIQADSLESIVTLADSLIAYNGMRTLGNVDAATFSGDLTGSVTAGAGETIDVSSGTLTLADDQISGDKIHGGRISNLEDLEADSLHGGWAEFTDSLLVRGDADDHAVLMIGDEVHGLLIGNTVDGVTVVDAEVLSPACRVSGGSSGWASVFMLAERLEWGLSRGSRITRFSCLSGNRPTRRLAQRLGARAIREDVVFRLALDR